MIAPASEPMQTSSQAKIDFSAAIRQKLSQVVGLYRRRHKTLHESKAIQSALKRMTPMHRRHAKGDFRHSIAEAKAEYDVSLWLVAAWRNIHGHSSLTNPGWADPSKKGIA